jgi:hypothetical protein
MKVKMTKTIKKKKILKNLQSLARCTLGDAFDAGIALFESPLICKLFHSCYFYKLR